MPHELPPEAGVTGGGPAKPRPAAPRSDPQFDAATAIAAVSRMQAAIRGGRAAFDRLRSELADMAKLISRARTARAGAPIKPEDRTLSPDGSIDAVLPELEGRINAMIFLIDFVTDREPPAALPVAAEADQVPTVSEVVTRLGRGPEPPAPGTEPHSDAPAPVDGVPSVAVLGAMVEALTAASAETPQALADPTPPAEPVAADPSATNFGPGTPPIAETELLSNHARIEAFPILAQEIGTAVIFSSPPQSAPHPPAAEPAAPDARPAHDPLAPIRAMSPEEKIALFS